MHSINKAQENDIPILTKIGKTSFIESHGMSAYEVNINQYVKEIYNDATFKTELSKTENIYHIIEYNREAVGYSKIILDAVHANIQSKNITKLERLYLLKAFYNLKLGLKLLNFNIELSIKNNQAGMWLFVWKENQRAVRFYNQAGFKIIGSSDFKITESHSNPNHIMYLKY